MIRVFHLTPLLAALALAGCGSSVQTSQFGNGPVVTAPPVVDAPPVVSSTPAQTTADARAMTVTSISSFLDPAAESQLSQVSRDQAAGAQFNALQFGRPGAPRNWQGDNGASGQVTVGPYVRVNNIDCRDFTHVVTLAGKSYSKKGTACREADGHWSVAANPTG
jgi:surface antigen